MVVPYWVIANRNEPNTTNVNKSANDKTRLRLERYFTPRPAPETAEMMESAMMMTKAVIRPTEVGVGGPSFSPGRISQDMSVIE